MPVDRARVPVPASQRSRYAQKPFPIVSEDMLKRMAGDPKLSRRASEQAAYTLRLTQYLNGIRKQHASLAGFVLHQERAKLTDNPVVMLFDCQQTESMPGLQVMDPGNSKDASVQRVYRETVLMLAFLRQVFKRNSIDNAGMTVMSSVHFGNGFHNAMWSGMRMIYGDGASSKRRQAPTGCLAERHPRTASARTRLHLHARHGRTRRQALPRTSAYTL